MSGPWHGEALRAGLLLAGALMLGASVGRPGLLLVLALVLYIAWHLYHLYRLERWLREGRAYHPPEAGGIWGEVFYLFYRVQQRARQRKRRLAAILSQFQEATAAMPDATVVLGSRDEIQWFNPAARQLLGLHPRDDVGQRVDNLVRYPGFADFLARGNDRGYALIPAPEEEGRTLSVRVVPFGRDQRLLLLRDVSQQQRLEQVRRDFVANVSHELRTPLTVVSGFLETLADADDDCAGAWGASIELMEQQARRMQHLVEDLLLLSQLESDGGRPGEEEVPMAALLATVRDDARQLSGEKRHRISLEADPDLNLYGSARELQSAFANLVNNAVRYTPAHGEIHIRWWADGTGAHLAVSDNGIGIEARHLPRLTERFYRVDVGRSRESGGTGLGLAIVKHILQRHEARLRVDSTPARGSTFTCDFPLWRSERPDGGQRPA